MMPVSFLIALLLAFGLEPSATGVPQADVGARVLETCGGITFVAALAFGLGLWVAFQVSQSGHPTSRLRRRYALGARLVNILSLVVYGWIIHSVGWSRIVRTNWGLSTPVLVGDFAIFLPYLLTQLMVWWGLFFAERALQIRLGLGLARGMGRYLVLRSRQSLGLILPVILMYVVRRDVFGRFFPGWDEMRGRRADRDRRAGHARSDDFTDFRPIGLADSLIAVWAAAPASRAHRRATRLPVYRRSGLGYREHDGQRLRHGDLATLSAMFC